MGPDHVRTHRGGDGRAEEELLRPLPASRKELIENESPECERAASGERVLQLARTMSDGHCREDCGRIGTLAPLALRAEAC